MTQVREPLMMGQIHANDEKCPFCPATTKEEHYRTYRGDDNNGGKLGDLVDKPEKFATTIEADARPKDGKRSEKDNRLNQSPINTSEPKETVKGDDLDWKFQCHHAIPGKQCLANDPVEEFITASDLVKYDTGYSINNPENGIWLPSGPEDGSCLGSWPGTNKPRDSFDMAKIAMDKFKRQFHLGHHGISVDVPGIDTATDQRYTQYVEQQLKLLHTALCSWQVCPAKDKKKRHLGNPRIHDALDHISSNIIEKLKGLPHQWNIFVSRHARDYTIKARNPTATLTFEK